jgi:hypothetical protein
MYSVGGLCYGTAHAALAREAKGTRHLRKADWLHGTATRVARVWSSHHVSYPFPLSFFILVVFSQLRQLLAAASLFGSASP